MQFQPRILVCLASDQIMQNTLPALRLRSAHVVIATSDVDPVRKGAEQVSHVPVSYTHLDVYKRQR